MRTSCKLTSAIFAVALLAATAAAQQSAKSGTYTGKWGPHAVGQIYEVGKGHVFVVGTFYSVFLNDVADGFLDKTEVICPLVDDIVNGLAFTKHGYCTMTDTDGDKAFLVWRGKGTSPGSALEYGGTFEWTGGTGKYSGLQGNNTWHGTDIGKTGGFTVVWDGEWRLPQVAAR